ncbi:hypothetical protein COCC4DRAFT_150771 [Bipolaris maydis ATCC 48331]|uniref:Uncharacterized protein n=2 Tax=Cochliobolus heterostrophus TaxID=5016 RepID=M2SPP9_COCH5|nr:uncharacterized protein COCC4DRAFT_150771 [Bipolaris maydis ATCC 48331]EMD87285.1 hypothetical protein COCHEDRAFT_1112667 [Bipolaris maydis C5]ENI00321.1 hypothetical protein COCC4DRAFT_150771 [Bipolaris maydis ATCC 48331]
MHPTQISSGLRGGAWGAKPALAHDSWWSGLCAVCVRVRHTTTDYVSKYTRTAVRDGPGDKTSARAGGQQRADSSARTADSERALWLVRRRRDERRTRPKAMESWQPRVGRPVAVPTRGGVATLL